MLHLGLEFYLFRPKGVESATTDKLQSWSLFLKFIWEQFYS